MFSLLHLSSALACLPPHCNKCASFISSNSKRILPFVPNRTKHNRPYITMIWTIEGWSSASKLSFLKMWFYIFHSFIYFYIFYIHAEIYILIQTESMEVFRNPFLERRFALRYTFIWDFRYGILSFEICFTVYIHLRFDPRYTFILNLVHHTTTKAAFICKDWQVFIQALGLQRKCRVHKDYMITPYIMDNWFIF